MKIKADLHTHTIASNHAYCTINEMAEGAALAGMEAIGITDHAPALGDAPHIYYFQNILSLPRKLSNIFILRGAEVNILNEKGEVDLPEKEMSNLDYTIASLHSPVFYPATKEEHTNALLNVMDNKNAMIIGHMGRCACEMDLDKVLNKAKKNDVLIEINSHSFDVSNAAKENCILIAKRCKEIQLPIVVCSDAHHSSQIGRFESAIKILSDIDFPEELIINSSIDKFINYLRKKGRTI